MFIGSVIYPAAGVLMVVYAFIYTWPLTESLNLGLRCACVLLDGTLLLSWASWLHFAAVSQIIFMEKVGLVLKSIEVNMR